MGSPVDLQSASTAVWQCRPDVWMTLLWGAPDAAEVEGVTRAWDRAFELDLPFRSLVDAHAVQRADPAAFASLAGYLIRRRKELHRLIQRQAVVRPGGLVGAVSVGLFTIVDWGTPTSLFTDGAAAVRWLVPDDLALHEERARWAESLLSVPPILRRLRELFDQDLGRIDVDVAARRLGTSRRTLQRQLRAAGTSFIDELDRARIAVAQRLLASSDEKIAVIARQLGFQAESRFRELFFAATGETPSEWRARRR